MYELLLYTGFVDASLFKLKNIKNISGKDKLCFTTKVYGKEFILAFHPDRKNLVLYKKNILDNFQPFNNIIFITKDKNLMEFCQNTNIPGYDRRVKLL